MISPVICIHSYSKILNDSTYLIYHIKRPVSSPFMMIIIHPNVIIKTPWIVERAGEGVAEVSFQFIHNLFTIHTVYSYVYSLCLRAAVRSSACHWGGASYNLRGNQREGDTERIYIPIDLCFSEPLFYMGVYGYSWDTMGYSSALSAQITIH